MPILRRLVHFFSSSVNLGGLDTTDYVKHIERKFGIVIRHEAVGTLATLDDLCKYVSAERDKQGHSLSEGDVWQTVRQITSEEFGVDPNDLHPGIRYVEDLNC